MSAAADRHRALLDAVSDGNRAFADLERSTGRAPEEGVLRDVLTATAQICRGVLDLLEVLVDEEARATVAELESQGAVLHLEDTSDRCCGPVQTAMGRLPHFHEVLNQNAQALFARKMWRPHLFNETRALWVRLKYTGGNAWGGGLLGRLEHVASTVSWTDADLEAIRVVASRATFLAQADPDRLATDHREVWLATLGGWLSKMEQNPGPARTMLADLIRHAPEPTGEVGDRLRDLAELPLLPDAVRAQAAELAVG